MLVETAPNKSLDVRAKQLLFTIFFGKCGVARIRFRPRSIQSLDSLDLGNIILFLRGGFPPAQIIKSVYNAKFSVIRLESFSVYSLPMKQQLSAVARQLQTNACRRECGNKRADTSTRAGQL